MRDESRRTMQVAGRGSFLCGIYRKEEKRCLFSWCWEDPEAENPIGFILLSSENPWRIPIGAMWW